MQDKINVLFVVPSLSRAGAETQIVDLINGCDEKLFNKILVCFESNLDQINKINRKSIDFYHFPRRKKWDVSVVRRIAKLIDRKKVQVIHSTLSISALISWAACKLTKNYKPRLIAAIHTTLNRSAKDEFWERFLYAHIFSRQNKIIFVCRQQAAHWHKKYPYLKRKSIVVHNGVDTSFFTSNMPADEREKIKKIYGIPQDAAVLCCIAAFRPEKGHMDLLSAFQKLNGYPHLLLAGDGVLRKAIEKRIEDLKLQNRVHLLGVLKDVRPILEIADISVLASTAETFSIAMLESMAMGVPVVCPDVGGLSEAVFPGVTGELYEIGSNKELITKLQKLLSKEAPLRLMGEQSVKVVSQQFSKEIMIEKTEKILQSQAVSYE